MGTRALEYDYTVSKWFLITTIILGIVGLLIGVIIALEMAYPELNNLFGEYGTFGRLKVLHTNTIIYGFVLSGVFSSWYYIAQHVLKVSLHESPFLQIMAKVHYFTYLLVIVLALISLLLGISTSKEYSEFEWPIDIFVVIFWLSWGIGISGLIGIRREKSLYISIWYFMATFLVVTALYLFNNMSIPTYFITGTGAWYHSVSVYAGSNDAMIQWWFGNNMVEFILTIPIIAMIYYFLPKEAGQAVYSYKLSLLSFWTLIFVYFLAGGHNLIYSTVPDWVQTVGSLFSIVLILPSWGNAINMLLTMKGEWQQLQTNQLIKFMVMASTFYMFSTLEGSIQAIKSVNALAHFTDWIPGHVHNGALGWDGFMIIAAAFHMAPRIFKREIYSKKLMNIQFWTQTVGIVLYFSSMWIAGITQGMMWRATDQYGNLAHSFIDTVIMIHPYFVIRSIGGVLYLVGFLFFTYNFYKTITLGRRLEYYELKNTSPMATI